MNQVQQGNKIQNSPLTPQQRNTITERKILQHRERIQAKIAEKINNNQ